LTPSDSDPVSDDLLMQRVAAGDLQAFEQIVHRHHRSAWNIAARFLGDTEEARDVVQDAFLRILEAAPRYRPSERFRAYLLRIVGRLCLDRCRRKRPVLMHALPELADPAPSPAETVESAERAEAIRRAIHGLPHRQRLAILMRYYEHCGYGEIAIALGVSEKAAERLLARGRKTLEALLTKWIQE